jgi:molybdopterin synthase catalytic subunit
MTLEHYPGMSEKALQSIVDKARKHWSIGNITVM